MILETTTIMSKTVAFIIPACNEQENISVLIHKLNQVMEPLGYAYTLTFIDDGSTDQTLNVLKAQNAIQPNVFYISFSRNFGHQNALKAGLDSVSGECVVMMDADLQHPPELVPVLLQKWNEGFDLVYTIRKEDAKIPLVKRKTSKLFYEIINNLSDIELEEGAADFRLMDRKVVDAFKQIKESDLFLRGLVKWMGFSQTGIEYYPAKRNSGESKYTIKKMVRFALQGITSFSTKPLYMASYLGFIFSLVAILYIPYIVYSYYTGHTVSGWASVIATITFFGGLQLMILGIIGLYLGKLFVQSKNRPNYIIKETNLPG